MKKKLFLLFSIFMMAFPNCFAQGNVWRVWSKCMYAEPSTYFDIDLTSSGSDSIVQIGPIVHYPEIYRLTLTGTYNVVSNTLIIDIRNDIDFWGTGVWEHCRTDRHTTQLVGDTINDVVGVLIFDNMAGCTTAIDLERLSQSGSNTDSCERPESVSAVGISSSAIVVHIADSTSRSYRISYTDGDILNSVVVSDTIYTITGLMPETTYIISVASVCNGTENAFPVSTSASTLSCSGCILTIDMLDSYGDGWNGNAINGYINGVNTFNATISGVSGSLSYCLNENDSVRLEWTEGSWSEEASFTISLGNTVIVSGYGSDYSSGDVLLTSIGCSTGGGDSIVYCDTLVVRDTLTIVTHDTVYVDTIVIVDHYWHDTIYVTQYSTVYVHDTTIVNNYIHDTAYVHDTTIVNNYILDTTYINNYIHDTIVVNNYIHDTTYVDNYISDTVTVMMPIDYYTLTLTSEQPTIGIVVGSGTYSDSTTVEIAAVAVCGNHFVQWSDGSTESPRHVMVREDMELTASFAADEVGITDVQMSGATITVQGNIITVQGAAGELVRIFDVVGRLLSTEMSVAETQSFRMMSTGVYLVQVGDGTAQRVVVR